MTGDDKLFEHALGDDYEDDEYITGSGCFWCCGDGMVENDDPIQRGPEKYLKCPSCGGSGKRKDMTLW